MGSGGDSDGPGRTDSLDDVLEIAVVIEHLNSRITPVAHVHVAVGVGLDRVTESTSLAGSPRAA